MIIFPICFIAAENNASCQTLTTTELVEIFAPSNAIPGCAFISNIVTICIYLMIKLFQKLLHALFSRTCKLHVFGVRLVKLELIF